MYCALSSSHAILKVMTKIFTRVAVLGIAGLVMSALPASVSAATPEASFNEETLTSESAKPKLSGEAEDVRSVRLLIENEDGKRVFRSREVRINKKDEWKVRVTKKLKDGEYTVSLLGPKSTDYKVLATDTLVIGDEDEDEKDSGKKKGSVYMSSLPLLAGGSGSAGASVPVAYVKVGNPSKDAVTLQGFTLKQNGSADVSAVTSFTTSDDKGNARGTVKSAFKNGTSFIALDATLAPGEVRIYTIKANLAANLSGAAGKTLMLDVADAKTSGSITSKFPIRGTTWTLVR